MVANEPLIYEIGGSGGILVEVDVVLFIHERRGGLRNGWDIVRRLFRNEGRMGVGEHTTHSQHFKSSPPPGVDMDLHGINQPKVHGQGTLCVSARERTCLCSCNPIRQSGKLEQITISRHAKELEVHGRRGPSQMDLQCLSPARRGNYDLCRIDGWMSKKESIGNLKITRVRQGWSGLRYGGVWSPATIIRTVFCR